MKPTAPALLALLVALPAAAAPPRPFNQKDLVTLRRVLEQATSPDGARAAYVLRTTDWDANRGRTDLWIVDLAPGATPRQLTTSPDAGESSPAWSPDGKILYFLSDRGPSQQVWALDMAGGEARAVTDLPVDVNLFRLAPDGRRLLVGLDVFVDCPDLDCTAKRLVANGGKKTTGRLYDRLLFRHWDTWEDGRRAHLFVVPLGGAGKPVDLMKWMDADSPVPPWGGVEEATFTPDGKSVVFAARNVGREEAWSTNYDLFLVPADGSKPPQALTAKNLAWDTQPVFSPDGKSLAYLAMSRPGYEADRFRIVLRDWATGAEREVAPKWDRSPSEMLWAPDGKSLLVTADHLGQHPAFAIDVQSGEARQLVADGLVQGLQVRGDKLVYIRDDLRSPADLFTARLDGSGAAPITSVNADLLAGVQLGDFEQFTFSGAGGDSVYAYLVKPVGFQAGKKYPLAMLIHGGPQQSFGNHWHYRWNPQAYAARGYVALVIDFHGSTGYGQAFSDAIRGDWGGKPLEDLKLGRAAAVKKYPFIDDARACALGASYGGYMINWIAGAWPEGFKCLVSHDGNLDEQMAYFDTEELWFPEWEHGGTPWDNPEGYQKHNPVNLVKNWKTPVLVVHGGRDYRVVDTQGLSTFTAAQRRGIPSQLLYFPDENHWVLKPQNSVLWHDTVLAWLDRWTKIGK